MKAATDPIAGNALHHYQLLRKLGSGGMGQVWLALDRRLGRKVALKLLPPDVVAEGARRKRFERESRALASFNHSNIVTIHSIEEADGRPFLVMEWIEGRSLEELIPPEGLTLERCLELAIPMVEAVAHAHQAGIVHRDLKPANVMVREDGVVKVVDFGISKMEAATVAEGLPASTEFRTAEGLAVGTLPYMSPQQLEGREVDARTDIFSLGVVLYEMATGRRPFLGDSSASVISSILRDPPPPFSASPRTLASARLEAVVLRCLAKAPSARFQSAGELAEALKEIAREAGLAEPSPAPSPLPSATGTVAILAAPTLGDLTLPPPATLSSTAPTPASPAPRWPDRLRLRWRIPALGVLLAIFLLAGLVIGLRRLPARPVERGGEEARTHIRQALVASGRREAATAVAVLPLSNLSGDARQEYFSDGTTEALITNLAKIGGLRVISRTSVMRFKNSRAPLPEIARELGVSYVLEGSLARAADQVVITTQLVDAVSDSVVWADRFEGGVKDLFAFQDKVAEQVVHAARIEVTGDDRSRLKPMQAVRPDAYELYLKARFLINQRTPEALLQALGQLQEVLRREPGYAPAWAAEAECYAHLVSPALASIPPREGIAKARAAARRAIELDGNLSGAHVVLGFATMESWDWPAAENEFRRAIALSPSNADAYLKYALYLNAAARHPEAITTIETARKLDPLSPAIRQAVAATYLFAGNPDRAIEAAKATLELQPAFWIGHFHLGMAYSSKRRYAEADAELRRALPEGPEHFVLAAIGRNFALWGKPQESRRLLAELEAKRKTTFVAPTSLAKICFALGDTDAGFGWLQKALDERDQGLMFLRSDPDFPPSIHSDPRFRRLLGDVGLAR